jgi:hypothetical protein
MKTFIKVEDKLGDVYNVEIDKISHFKQTCGYGANATKFKLVLAEGTQIQLEDESAVCALMANIVGSSRDVDLGA